LLVGLNVGCAYRVFGQSHFFAAVSLVEALALVLTVILAWPAHLQACEATTHAGFAGPRRLSSLKGLVDDNGESNSPPPGQ
jgi:hypothetical protein